MKVLIDEQTPIQYRDELAFLLPSVPYHGMAVTADTSAGVSLA